VGVKALVFDGNEGVVGMARQSFKAFFAVNDVSLDDFVALAVEKTHFRKLAAKLLVVEPYGKGVRDENGACGKNQQRQHQSDLEGDFEKLAHTNIILRIWQNIIYRMLFYRGPHRDFSYCIMLIRQAISVYIIGCKKSKKKL